MSLPLPADLLNDRCGVPLGFGYSCFGNPPDTFNESDRNTLAAGFGNGQVSIFAIAGETRTVDAYLGGLITLKKVGEMATRPIAAIQPFWYVNGVVISPESAELGWSLDLLKGGDGAEPWSAVLSSKGAAIQFVVPAWTWPVNATLALFVFQQLGTIPDKIKGSVYSRMVPIELLGETTGYVVHIRKTAFDWVKTTLKAKLWVIFKSLIDYFPEIRS